jgi:hypothetical protein
MSVWRAGCNIERATEVMMTTKGIQAGPDGTCDPIVGASPIKRAAVIALACGIAAATVVLAADAGMRDGARAGVREMVTLLPPTVGDDATGINDGPDPVGRVHGKKGPSTGGAPCSQEQRVNCIVGCYEAGAAVGQYLVVADCHLGPEITGEYMSGAIGVCSCRSFDPDSGVAGVTMPPPLTDGY